MWILFHQDAGSPDFVKSILHSLKFHDIISTENIDKDLHWDNYIDALKSSHAWTQEHYERFSLELDEKNWQRDTVYWNDRQVLKTL